MCSSCAWGSFICFAQTSLLWPHCKRRSSLDCSSWGPSSAFLFPGSSTQSTATQKGSPGSSQSKCLTPTVWSVIKGLSWVREKHPAELVEFLTPYDGSFFFCFYIKAGTPACLLAVIANSCHWGINRNQWWTIIFNINWISFLS